MPGSPLDAVASARAAALHCLRGNPNSLQVDVATAAVGRLAALAERAALVDAVRAAWGALLYLAPTQIDPYTFGWVVCSAGLRVPVNPRCEGPTEEAAWRAALDAAPKGGGDAE